MNHLEYMSGEIDSLQYAREFYRKATKYRPDYAEAWTNLSACWTAAQRTQDAMESARKALALSPGSVDARINLGAALHMSRSDDNASEALQLYESARRLDPKRAEVLLNLGLLHLEHLVPATASSEARYKTALDYFAKYKDQKQTLSDNDPVESYIREATERLNRR